MFLAAVASSNPKSVKNKSEKESDLLRMPDHPNPLDTLRSFHEQTGSPLTFEALYDYVLTNNPAARTAAREVKRLAKQRGGAHCDWNEVSRLVVLAGWGFQHPDYSFPALKARRDPQRGIAASRARSALKAAEKMSPASMSAGASAAISAHLKSAIALLDDRNRLAAYFKARSGGADSRPAHRPTDNSRETRIPVLLCQYFRSNSGGVSPALKLVAEITNAAVGHDTFTLDRVREIERRYRKRPHLNALLRGR